MSARIFRAMGAAAALLLAQAGPVFGQATGETLDYLNARLLHSSVLRVDEAGLVRMRTPGETLTFNLKDAAINGNDLNGDHRVRIATEGPIQFWDGERREEVKYRQSFVCRSRTAAVEAVAALRRLKASLVEKDPAYAVTRRKLDAPVGGCATVLEAMDLVNDQLAHSVLLKVDAQGVMTLQATEDVYRVDLARAEFGLNESSGDPRVRVYGNWCLDKVRDNRKEEVPRESFTARSKGGALDVIRALYGIKGAVTGSASAPRVERARVTSWTTVPQAIDAINDHLEISILMGVDARGEAILNASDAIYHLDLTRCTFGEPKRESHLFGLLTIASDKGVNIACSGGLKRYTSRDRWETVNDQNFSCRSESDAKVVRAALEFIRGQVRR